jgi:hypothetical protein
VNPDAVAEAGPPAVAPAVDLRELAWRCLVAIGAGAITGAVVGGLGGRLVMLVIRQASGGSVQGLLTDDGFRIGQFTTATVFLLTVAAGLGGATGGLYLLLRGALPRRGRAVMWAAALGLYTGADILTPNKFDFAALDPKPFIIISFVLLPVAAALTIALTIERLLTVEPWSRRGLTVVLVLGALPLVPALPVFALIAMIVLAVRRVPQLTDRLRRPAKVIVPIALSLLMANAGVELWFDATEIL